MPSVRETHEFIPDPKKPSYYVFIWGVPHSMSNPPRPQQIFRADTWLEAQNFARVFASLTMLQYATAIALAPKVPDEMGGHGEELARENYWQPTKGNVTFDRYTMPVSRVEQLQKEFPQGAAYETDPEERRLKLRELLKKAAPGETLADVLAREWDRERLAKAEKAWKELWAKGDFSKRQGRLTPIKKPKRRGLVKAYEKEKFTSEEAKKRGLVETERLRYQFFSPDTGGKVYRDKRLTKTGDVVVKGEMHVYYAAKQDRSKPRIDEIAAIFSSPDIKPVPGSVNLPAFVYNLPVSPGSAASDARSIINYLKSGVDYQDVYFEAMRNGLDDREYTEWIVDIGLPEITSGQYILEWTPPKDEDIPLFVRELAAGVPLEEAQKRELNREAEPGQEVLLPSTPPRKVKKFKEKEKKKSSGTQTTFAFEIEGKKYHRFRRRPMAFEEEKKELPLKDPKGFFKLTAWAFRNKKPEVGKNELNALLDEVRRSHPDSPADEAIAEIEAFGAEFAQKEAEGAIGSAAGHGPEAQLASAIDFETIEEKSRAADAGRRRLEEMRKELQELVEAKVITRDQARDEIIGLEREKIPSKQKRMFEQTIDTLEKQLAAARLPPPKQRYKLGQKVQYLGKPDYEVTDADLQNRAWVYTVRRIGMPGEFIAREGELRPDVEAPVEEKVPRDAWERLISYLNKTYDNMAIDGRPVQAFVGNLANWIEENVKAGRRKVSFGDVAEFDLLTGTLRTKEKVWDEAQDALVKGGTVISVQPTPAPPGAPQMANQARIEELEMKRIRSGLSKRELDELLALKEGRPYEPGKAPTPRVRIETPKVVEPARKFSQPEMDFLESAFKTIISRKLRRDPFPAELDQFEKLLATMEAMSPPLKFASATRRVEDLARGLAAKGTSGRIVVRHGQSRVNELMQKALKEPLTEEEQEELARLEGRAPEEIFEREEVFYEKPKVKLIAVSGPVPAFAGSPLEHGKDFPRDLGSYWSIEIAELNAANFERKGYVVTIEQEK